MSNFAQFLSLFWRGRRQGSRTSSFMRFLNHIQTHHTR